MFINGHNTIDLNYDEIQSKLKNESLPLKIVFDSSPLPKMKEMKAEMMSEFVSSMDLPTVTIWI